MVGGGRGGGLASTAERVALSPACSRVCGRRLFVAAYGETPHASSSPAIGRYLPLFTSYLTGAEGFESVGMSLARSFGNGREGGEWWVGGERKDVGGACAGQVPTSWWKDE